MQRVVVAIVAGLVLSAPAHADYAEQLRIQSEIHVLRTNQALIEERLRTIQSPPLAPVLPERKDTFWETFSKELGK